MEPGRSLLLEKPVCSCVIVGEEALPDIRNCKTAVVADYIWLDRRVPYPKMLLSVLIS